MDVSVALPTFNGETYLREQLDSITNQSRKPDEIVIYDDDSSDETPAILREYKQKYPAMIELYLSTENVGFNRNFSRAISETSGDFIALSDQDDIWDRDKLATQLSVVNQRTALVTHNSRLIKQNGDGTGSSLWDGLIVSPASIREQGVEREFLVLLSQNFAQGASMLFSADLKEYLDPIPSGFLYDHFISLLASVTGRIEVIDTCLLSYRQHDEQVRGASSSVPVKIRRQFDKDLDEFYENKVRWQAFLDRIAEVDSAALQYEKGWIEQKVNRRRRYDAGRYDLVDPETGFNRKIRSLYWLATDGYFEFAHPGLAVVDVLNVLRFSIAHHRSP